MTLPDGLRIRRMVDRDLDAVMAIERETESAPHWSASDYLALFQPNTDLLLKRQAMAAEVADEVAGFAIVRLVADEAELESIVVAGIGEAKVWEGCFCPSASAKRKNWGHPGSIWRCGRPTWRRSGSIGGLACWRQVAVGLITATGRRTLC